MNKLFGTDGIRGVANTYPMTSEVALKIGRAVTFFCQRQTDKPTILIGRDTRISGHMIESAIVSGVCSMGADVHLAGVIPTPGVAFLASSSIVNAGIMVSASHNPFYDNGIKLFNREGHKLSDEQESQIEGWVLDDTLVSSVNSISETGNVNALNDAADQYAAFLKHTLNKKNPFKGIKVILDCSNGATFNIAPKLFTELGADVKAMFVSPDGKNINENCGSEYTDILAQSVIESQVDVGLAFDGDGDRLIAIDDKGRKITGDQILAISANHMKQQGRLKNNLVVSTVMSNMGLGVALKAMDIDHKTAQVGDRYVVEQMKNSGAVLGGEDSGHVIFLDQHTTGDGILTGLNLIQIMSETSASLSQLADIMTVYPQTLLNVTVKQKPEIGNIPEIMEAIESVETSLGKEGRVLVRYSGTQPLCRIMVEGPSREITENHCQQIAGVIKGKLS